MLEAETALAELVAALATVDADMCVILYKVGVDADVRCRCRCRLVRCRSALKFEWLRE